MLTYRHNTAVAHFRARYVRKRTIGNPSPLSRTGKSSDFRPVQGLLERGLGVVSQRCLPDAGSKSICRIMNATDRKLDSAYHVELPDLTY